jgi:hypothetical protein
MALILQPGAGSRAGRAFSSVMAVPISAAVSLMLDGTISVLLVLASCAIGVDGPLGHLQLHRLVAAGVRGSPRRSAGSPPRVASATAVIAAASPSALLISACFSPSERR